MLTSYRYSIIFFFYLLNQLILLRNFNFAIATGINILRYFFLVFLFFRTRWKISKKKKKRKKSTITRKWEIKKKKKCETKVWRSSSTTFNTDTAFESILSVFKRVYTYVLGIYEKREWNNLQLIPVKIRIHDEYMCVNPHMYRYT